MSTVLSAVSLARDHVPEGSGCVEFACARAEVWLYIFRSHKLSQAKFWKFVIQSVTHIYDRGLKNGEVRAKG